MYKHAYLYFTAAFAVTMLGFWPSFFSNPGQNDLLHMMHGAVATGWMLMLIAQAWLISHGHVRWHRRVGKGSYLLAPAFMISSGFAIHAMLADPHGLPHPLRMSLAFLDIGSLAVFALLYALAIWNRQVAAQHARYMSATVLVVVTPALGRVFAIYVPGIRGLAGALNPTFWVLEAACLALVLADLRQKRPMPAYPITGAFMIAMNWAIWQAPNLGWFRAFANAAGMPA